MSLATAAATPVRSIVLDDDEPMPLWVPPHWTGSPVFHACKSAVLLWDLAFKTLKILARAGEKEYDIADRCALLSLW